MPYLWDSTSNEPSLNKMFKSEEIFYLFSTQYSVFTKHCILQWPCRTNNFFIINATPIRQHLKRIIFKQNTWIQRDFSLILYAVFTKHCTLQWPWITINFFIINATPIIQHLKRIIFKQNIWIRRDFSLI